MVAGRKARKSWVFLRQSMRIDSRLEMKSKLILSFSFLIFMAFAPVNFAGTLVFKDGTILSDAEIVSINEDNIVLMKDKTKRSFPLKSLKSFSQANVSVQGGSEEFPGDFSDYTVSIIEFKIPKAGEDKDGNTEKCEISYNLSRLPGKGKKLKMPYFYLYVLTSRENETEGRKIYRFCYPDAGKPKGSNYDLAAIMDKVSGFDRQIWGEDEQDFRRNDISGRKVNFELKKIGGRKILAYHLEVWGNKSVISEKTAVVPQNNLEATKVSDKWWEKY